MFVIMINCPVSGRAFSTGIETDVDTFRDMPDVTSRLDCPHCGRSHAWSKKEAWLTDDSEKASAV